MKTREEYANQVFDKFVADCHVADTIQAIANNKHDCKESGKCIADFCYAVADAMVAKQGGEQ